MPRITLNKFYNYVFDNLASPRQLRPPPGVTLNEDAQKTIEASDNQKKKKDFDFITENHVLSAKLRNMLRDLGNTALENLLYGNTSDHLESTADSAKYAIPSDEDIKEQFTRLEREFGYFGTDPKAAEQFAKLFKACKLTADYIEENNSDDNSVAYTRAYKLMVLFGVKANALTLIDSFLGTHAGNLSKPVHDSLVLPIPINSPPLKYLERWRKLISDSGTSVLSLLQNGAAIEEVLETKKPFTFTLDSIKAAATQVTYKNSEKNPELAKLCLQYHVGEDVFNKCLAIGPKQSDNLPEVTVDGKMVGRSGYFLVKLPVDDSRAGILGHITNCCQSIGSHSERCVVDGITRENNGFYVLLKAKPGAEKLSTAPRPTHDNGRINYDNFEIVGQGYAWLSDLDNLTFDSWENLTPSTEDAVIQAMLPQFAKQSFEQRKDIGRITLGTGGKTPAIYKDSSVKTSHPESIAEGYQYFDSSEQVTIALNPAVEQSAERINARLQEMGLNVSVDIWSIKQAQWFESLLNESTIAQYNDTLEKGLYQALLQRVATEPSVLESLFYLHQEQILTHEMAKILLALKTQEAENIGKSLRYLIKAKPSLCTTDNFKRLVEITADLGDINNVCAQLVCLSGTNLLTEDNFNLILRNRKYAKKTVDLINHLLDMLDIASISSENILLLIQNPEHYAAIDEGLSRLKDLNSSLVSNENCITLLIQNPQHINSLLQGIKSLCKLNKDLITVENRTFFAQNAKNADQLGAGLASLYLASPELITTENRTLLAKHAEHAEKLGVGLAALYQANPDLIRDEKYINLLTQHAEHAGMLGDGLAFLYKSDPELFADVRNISLLAEHAKDACDLGKVLVLLNKAVPSLLTDENRAYFAKHPEYAPVITETLRYLHQQNPALLTQDNLKLLTDHNPRDLHKINTALVQLNSNKAKSPYQIITNENFKFCARNLETAIICSTHLSELCYQGDPSLITDGTRALFLEYPNLQDSRALASTILSFHKFNQELLTDNICRQILSSGQSYHISQTLALLGEKNSDLITAENLEILVQLPKVQGLATGLTMLSMNDPSLITDQNFKLLTQEKGKYLLKIIDDFEERIELGTAQTPKAVFEEVVAKIVKPPANAAGNAASCDSKQPPSASEDTTTSTKIYRRK